MPGCVDVGVTGVAGRVAAGDGARNRRHPASRWRRACVDEALLLARFCNARAAELVVESTGPWTFPIATRRAEPDPSSPVPIAILSVESDRGSDRRDDRRVVGDRADPGEQRRREALHGRVVPDAVDRPSISVTVTSFAPSPS